MFVEYHAYQCVFKLDGNTLKIQKKYEELLPFF